MKLLALVCLMIINSTNSFAARRAVVIKVDGLPGQLLADFVKERDSSTGLSRLPWIERVFFQDGAWVKNFYVRGVSVSAPSWQVLETGQHLVIRGNVEFDRYTMTSYDYLNFFPFFFKYARSKSVDMPIVEAMDRLGIPLLADRFAVSERYQGIQLFQRGVNWASVKSILWNRFSSRSPRKLFDEWQAGMQWRSVVEEQIERELVAQLQNQGTLYLDYFTPEFDHLAHLDNNRENQFVWLRELDRLVGRIQTGIERSGLAQDTVLVLISDHGMNTSADALSQQFDLIKFFGGAAGGSHHVVTNRHPMEAFKVRGLNPFVSAVITPSTESSYLSGQQNRYPTALLDLDGNERTSVYLRSNVLNKIHLLLQDLQRKDTAPDERARAGGLLRVEIDAHRESWRRLTDDLYEELNALLGAIDRKKQTIAALPDKEDAESRRLRIRVDDWSTGEKAYRTYRQTLLNLLSLDVEHLQPGSFRIEDYVPPLAMGDGNTIHDLQNYVTGFDQGSFRTMNYFAALTALRARNNVQKQIGNRPVDFVAVRVPQEALSTVFPEEVEGAVWLYVDDSRQALILRQKDSLRYLPVARLSQEADGQLRFDRVAWDQGFPLQIWEDAHLEVRGERTPWLDEWHTETEWLRATHRTRYSNAVISLAEYFFWQHPANSDLVNRFEVRRRQNTDSDFMIVASDGWNFSARGFNPGGNHGSFLRASTLSTLMFSGAGIPRGIVVDEPYDGLSFAPTLLRLVGKPHGDLPGACIEELFVPQLPVQ